MTEVVLIQVSFLLLVLNKNNNNEQAEYQGIFIPFKNNIYSKQGSNISLLFGAWDLILSPHAAAQPEMFQVRGRFVEIGQSIKVSSKTHTKKATLGEMLEFFLLDTFRMKNL